MSVEIKLEVQALDPSLITGGPDVSRGTEVEVAERIRLRYLGTRRLSTCLKTVSGVASRRVPLAKGLFGRSLFPGRDATFCRAIAACFVVSEAVSDGLWPPKLRSASLRPRGKAAVFRHVLKTVDAAEFLLFVLSLPTGLLTNAVYDRLRDHFNSRKAVKVVIVRVDTVRWIGGRLKRKSLSGANGVLSWTPTRHCGY